MKFKTKMCAKTIRNNIYEENIYDIKSSDMIYTKEYKEKNKDKRICEKLPPEKSIDYRPEEANTRKEIIVKIPGKKAEYVAKALDLIERKYKKEFYRKFESSHIMTDRNKKRREN